MLTPLAPHSLTPLTPHSHDVTQITLAPVAPHSHSHHTHTTRTTAGYALLFESMLGSVLDARDRLLVPGGAVLPDLATLHLAAAGEGATGLRFWSDVYGLSMAPVAHSLRDSGAPPPPVAPALPAALPPACCGRTPDGITLPWRCGSSTSASLQSQTNKHTTTTLLIFFLSSTQL